MDITAWRIEDSVAYYNGKVYTLNSGHVAEAFIVSPEGVFFAVGTTEEILQTANANGMVSYNLCGRFVMPGIHDAHVHLLWAGISHISEVRLTGDTTVENIGQRVQEGQCACPYQNVYQDWVVANAFEITDFDRSSLDKDFPDTPVLIHGGAFHSAFLNTAGLVNAGYDVENEPNMNGAMFGRRPDGSLTGELVGLAMNKAMIAKGSPKLTHAKHSIKAAIRRLHRAGVTSCQEAATNTVILHALRELDQENALHMDIAAHSVYAPEFLANEHQSSLQSLIDKAPGLATKHVRTNFVKIVLDGLPLPPLLTAAGLDDYGNIEKNKILVDDIVEAVRRFDARGMTVKIHAAGRGSVRLALDAIEAARKGSENHTGAPVIKHEIAHCNSVCADDFVRFEKQNVTAELSPAMFFDHPLTQASNESMSWDLTKFLKARIYPITIGSDFDTRDDPCLLPKVHKAVRQVGDWVVETNSVTDVASTSLGANLILEMLTKHGAAAVGMSEQSGSIVVGKRANFIMLDRDIVDEGCETMADFENVKVLKTWFEGELVWDAEAA